MNVADYSTEMKHNIEITTVMNESIDIDVMRQSGNVYIVIDEGGADGDRALILLNREEATKLRDFLNSALTPI